MPKACPYNSRSSVTPSRHWLELDVLDHIIGNTDAVKVICADAFGFVVRQFEAQYKRSLGSRFGITAENTRIDVAGRYLDFTLLAEFSGSGFKKFYGVHSLKCVCRRAVSLARCEKKKSVRACTLLLVPLLEAFALPWENETATQSPHAEICIDNGWPDARAPGQCLRCIVHVASTVAQFLISQMKVAKFLRAKNRALCKRFSIICLPFPPS